MAVRTIPTATLTQGYVNQGWYNGRKATTVRQRVTATHAAQFVTLNYTLPPRARIIWAEILTQTNVLLSTQGDGTSTAGAVALMFFPTTGTAVLTAPPTTGTQSNPAGTNGYLFLQTPGITTSTSSASSDTNAQSRGVPLIFGTVATNNAVNTQTVGAMVAIVPASTSNNRVNFNSTNTVNLRFGTDTSTTTNTNTCGTFDVTLYVEEYDQAPYA